MSQRRGKQKGVQQAIKFAMQNIAKVGERKPIVLRIVEDDYLPVLNVTSELGHVQCTEEVFTKALKILGYDV